MRNQRKRIFNEEKEFCKVNFSVVFRIFVNEPRENETSNHRGTEQENTGQKESVWNIPRNCNTHRRRKKKIFCTYLSLCVVAGLVSGLRSLVSGRPAGKVVKKICAPSLSLVVNANRVSPVQSSPSRVSQSVGRDDYSGPVWSSIIPEIQFQFSGQSVCKCVQFGPCPERGASAYY